MFASHLTLWSACPTPVPPVLWLQMYPTLPEFYMGASGLSLVPHAYTAYALSVKSFIQFYLFVCFNIELSRYSLSWC